MFLPEFAGAAPDRDRIISKFRHFDAVSPTSAITRAKSESQSPVVWERMRNEGIIREASPGTFYLDETRLPPARRSRWVNIGVGAFILLLFLLWVVRLVASE